MLKRAWRSYTRRAETFLQIEVTTNISQSAIDRRNAVHTAGARVKDLEIQNDNLRKENCDLKERIREQERYRTRWCLCIKGIEERKDEDIRSRVIQTLGKTAPDLESKMEEVVDIVHQLGKRMDSRNRNVIMLFAQRWMKEEIWRRTKDSPICKAEGI
ncbi:Trafficking kinesin-binding protein 1 [Labeo rohita]|uniref:Trafficking kinesin-binding protein 1 n=1 Tax=Labeo rohita TaxID=84645 RepID=A0ABQ8MSI6_LABRO|nr:Trafficking kinesin-binding protein 1 [Labeo rohita]